MKTLYKTALIIAAITSAIHAQEGQLRLAPSEINSLATVNAGAGTSGVSGIQTRSLGSIISWVTLAPLMDPSHRFHVRDK